MSPRLIVSSMLAAALIAVVLVLSLGGEDRPYGVRLELGNAAGLRSGSDVTMGGLRVGRVDVRLGAGDKVIADLTLDREHAPVGQDVSAAITAVNFLGKKRVELDKGTAADAAPSGYVLPPSRVTTSTDLDQVLNVLDADTRTRLTILLNEAGAAFTDRRADVSELLQEVPPSMVRATKLMNELVSDNDTLARLVARSDGFVNEIARRRKGLSRMVDVVGRTAETVAARRVSLRQTLARAPRTLATMQRFLGELKATTVPLGPAARDITATAPALSETLAQLDPFRRAADPALVEAVRVAPELTRLAGKATPVLRRAAPTASALAGVSHALPPVTDTLDHSIDNVLAVVENWSRAIQFRDGLSHVFRGEASMTNEGLRSLVDRLVRKARPGTRSRNAKRPAATSTPSVPPSAPRRQAPPAVRVPGVGETVDRIGKGVRDTLNGVTGKLPGTGAGPRDPGPSSGSDGLPLLDFLLGS